MAEPSSPAWRDIPVPAGRSSAVSYPGRAMSKWSPLLALRAARTSSPTPEHPWRLTTRRMRGDARCSFVGVKVEACG